MTGGKTGDERSLILPYHHLPTSQRRDSTKTGKHPNVLSVARRSLVLLASRYLNTDVGVFI